MRLKNYQEDLVLNLIELVLEDYADIEPDETFLHDVAAYTLNRVPPKYIMSERGFTRFASVNIASESNGDGLMSLVELLIVINKAIGVVQSRRRFPHVVETEDEIGAFLGEPGREVYVHNFPQLIGRVLDKSNHEPVFGACVTLYREGEVVVPAQTGWINPYYTNQPTRGFFSFWPQAVRTESEQETFVFKITIDHPDYHFTELEKSVSTQGVYVCRDTIDGDAVLELETTFVDKNSIQTLD